MIRTVVGYVSPSPGEPVPRLLAQPPAKVRKNAAKPELPNTTSNNKLPGTYVVNFFAERTPRYEMVIQQFNLQDAFIHTLMIRGSHFTPALVASGQWQNSHINEFLAEFVEVRNVDCSGSVWDEVSLNDCFAMDLRGDDTVCNDIALSGFHPYRSHMPDFDSFVVDNALVMKLLKHFDQRQSRGGARALGDVDNDSVVSLIDFRFVAPHLPEQERVYWVKRLQELCRAILAGTVPVRKIEVVPCAAAALLVLGDVDGFDPSIWLSALTSYEVMDGLLQLLSEARYHDVTVNTLRQLTGHPEALAFLKDLASSEKEIDFFYDLYPDELPYARGLLQSIVSSQQNTSS